MADEKRKIERQEKERRGEKENQKREIKGYGKLQSKNKE